MDNAIFPECFVDTNLVETLVPPTKRNNKQGYNHQKGCGTVASRMQNKFADRFALGIVDKDKHQLDYLKEFTEVISKGSLILHKHKNKHHYIIQLSPAIERFILSNADAADIVLEDFDLPSDLGLLIKESKTETSKYDKRFTLLFKALRNSGTPDILRLAAWVKYLKEENYKANIDRLKEL